MKRLLAMACVVLLFFLSGCRLGTESMERLPERTPACAEKEPGPSPNALETQLPSAETVNESCLHYVKDEWYVKRNSELHALLKRNGKYKSEKDVNLAIDRMQIDPDRPMVALTFDDGPVPGVTDKILDVLEKYNVRATFFVLGSRFGHPEATQITQRAISLGCEIGNHTWGHQNLTKLNYTEKKQTISATNNIIYEKTGFTIHLLRPPGGRSDTEVKKVAKSLNMAVVNWSQSGNVHERDPERIAQNVQKQIVNGKELHDGDIILLHDTKTYMVDAVEIIVPQLLNEGYQLVTVWELLHCSQDGYSEGELYQHR